jgi:hypothetical protein
VWTVRAIAATSRDLSAIRMLARALLKGLVVRR